MDFHAIRPSLDGAAGGVAEVLRSLSLFRSPGAGALSHTASKRGVGV